MTAEEMVLQYWGYNADQDPSNLSVKSQERLKDIVILMHTWEEHKMKKVRADAAAYEILNTAQEREIDKLKREVIGMDGEIGLLKKWLSDALTTIAEEPEYELSTLRSELSARDEELKRLREAVKTGLQDIKRATEVNIDEDDVFNAADTMGDALEKAYILTDALLSAITPPESKKTIMNRFKPGDKARVIGDKAEGHTYHHFKIGSEVEIIKYDKNDNVWSCKAANISAHQSIYDCDLEPIEPVQEEESPWIDIKETLPEYGIEVLWHMKDGNMYVDSLEYTDPYKGLNCTHWMPLPKPPFPG